MKEVPNASLRRAGGCRKMPHWSVELPVYLGFAAIATGLGGCKPAAETNIQPAALSDTSAINSAPCNLLQIDRRFSRLSLHNQGRAEILQLLEGLGVTLVAHETLPGGSLETNASACLTIPELLDQLLPDTAYQATYSQRPSDSGLRLTALTMGTTTDTESDRIASDGYRAGQPSPLDPQDLYLGDEPYQSELSERLADTNPETRAFAVGELPMSPTGIAIAQRLFDQDPSTEVTVAVLELMEQEDMFAARKMIADALTHQDARPVLVALNSIEQRLDYSLLPRVNALTQSPLFEVSSRAEQVLQTLNQAYGEVQ